MKLRFGFRFPSVFGSAIVSLKLIVILITVTTVIVVVVGKPPRPWCAGPIRRDWRFPPPPPPHPPTIPSFYNWRPPKPKLSGRPLLTLFQHENHNGLKYEQYVGQRCYNLPNVINDQASSLNTHGRCVMVCKEKDCKRCKKMFAGSPGHFKLSEVRMDDVISSVKPCGDIYE